MSLVNLRNIIISFGLAPILNQANFILKKRERVCLVGRNGEGKSTLMKLIAGEIKLDDGEIVIERGAKIGSHSTIMPGVRIGENAVVGAYSFIKRNVPDNETWMGIPAKKK